MLFTFLRLAIAVFLRLFFDFLLGVRSLGRAEGWDLELKVELVLREWWLGRFIGVAGHLGELLFLIFASEEVDLLAKVKLEGEGFDVELLLLFLGLRVALAVKEAEDLGWRLGALRFLYDLKSLRRVQRILIYQYRRLDWLPIWLDHEHVVWPLLSLLLKQVKVDGSGPFLLENVYSRLLGLDLKGLFRAFWIKIES